MNLINYLPDKFYLQIKYFQHFKTFINWSNPTTYNEKIQFLKVYDRNPDYTLMVDKYLVKEYVSNIIGKEYIIPTLGVWNNPDEIDFSLLPNQFVLKWNHDSGSIIICKDKNNFDIDGVKKKLKKYKKHNGFYYGREYPYKNVNPKIIAEQYMEDSVTSELRDYKFFCFNGKVKLMFIASNRHNENEPTTFDFFDEDFNYIDLRQGHPNKKNRPGKPVNFEKMSLFASRLSENIPHIRVDFYEINEKLYFSELTFYHFSGFVPFEPEKWDYTMGSWLDIMKLNYIKNK